MKQSSLFSHYSANLRKPGARTLKGKSAGKRPGPAKSRGAKATKKAPKTATKRLRARKKPLLAGKRPRKGRATRAKAASFKRNHSQCIRNVDLNFSHRGKEPD